MSIELLEKWSDKKKEHQQTNKQTEKIWPISSSAGTRFWAAKCQIPVAKPLKSSPQNEQPISLKKSTNGHLRLVRSLALSSSCACGAINLWSKRFTFVAQMQRTSRANSGISILNKASSLEKMCRNRQSFQPLTFFV